MLADWVKRLTGADPAKPVRGFYSTDAELMALAGPLGLPRLFDRLLTAGGLRRVAVPDVGDVAIVSVDGYPPRGAIRVRRGFVIVGEQGLSCAPPAGVRVVMAWSLA